MDDWYDDEWYDDDERAQEYSAYRQRIADDHYADQIGTRVCRTTLTVMSAGAMLWAMAAEQWPYAVVFAVFLLGTRVGVWIAAMTITLDGYGQPLTGTDADRLAQLQARNYWASHVQNPGVPRHGGNDSR